MEFFGQGGTAAACQSTQHMSQAKPYSLHAQPNESAADYKMQSLSSVKGNLRKISVKLKAVLVVVNVTVTHSKENKMGATDFKVSIQHVSLLCVIHSYR
jgi:hypothetical protein